MKEIMSSFHPKILDLLDAFGLKNKGVQSFKFIAEMNEVFKIQTQLLVDVPEKDFTDYFEFGLVPLDWTTCCIGCKYYGFGKYCKLLYGMIPESPYQFYCKSWEPTSRNLILYRRFIDG